MKRRTYIRLIAGLACLGWLLSGAIHEVGHALTANGAGMEIVYMQPWAFLGRAHVRLAGETTRLWYAAINISGMLFTVLVGICGTVATASLAKTWRTAGLGVWLFFPMMCQCLAWVALPAAIMLGARAPRDDVTSFLQDTGWPAYVVLLMGLALAATCAAVLRWAVNRIRACPDAHGTD